MNKFSLTSCDVLWRLLQLVDGKQGEEWGVGGGGQEAAVFADELVIAQMSNCLLVAP